MNILGAASIDRAKLLQFKMDAFNKLIKNALAAAKLDTDRIKSALYAYLKYGEGMQMDNDGLVYWLQNNSGPIVALIIFQNEEGKIDFLLKTDYKENLK